MKPHKKATRKHSERHPVARKTSRARMKRPAPSASPAAGSGWNDEQQYATVRPSGEFTAGEIGAPDAETTPDQNNPLGVQGGRGPLNEEGEGDRQNDQLAELESDVDAKKDLENRR